MAWTTPRDWTTGEFVTEAIMDTHIKDNLLALGPHLIARKTSDQSVVSSTTLVNDNTLTMPVAANDVWLFRFCIRWSASGAGDGKFALTFPASGEVASSTTQMNSVGDTEYKFWEGTTPAGGSPTAFGSVTAANHWLEFGGIYVGAGTAGNLTLQFAQATSDGTATIVRAQSTLWGVKLA